ncbi:hypothetical protein RMATCC62417_06370 [Rhizopus microsporus]|nr:hypothetical protein RMATCC62417_06370 [Rhizopus microsporus]
MPAAYQRLIQHDGFITNALVDHCLVPFKAKKVNPNYASFLTDGHRKAIKDLICKYQAKTNRLRDSLLNHDCFRRFTRRMGVEELKEFKKHFTSSSWH